MICFRQTPCMPCRSCLILQCGGRLPGPVRILECLQLWSPGCGFCVRHGVAVPVRGDAVARGSWPGSLRANHGSRAFCCSRSLVRDII